MKQKEEIKKDDLGKSDTKQHGTEQKKIPFLGKWALIVGIVIVMNMFFSYSLSLLYPAPDYATFFPQKQEVVTYDTKESCLNVGGQWTPQVAQPLLVAPTPQSPQPASPSVQAPQSSSQPTPTSSDGIVKTAAVAQGYCDPDFTTRKQYEAAQKTYERMAFFVLMILGVIVLIIGASVSHSVLSPALAWGGVLSLLIASTRYWSFAGDGLRVILLACALGGLIYLAVQKFSEEK